MTQEQSQLKSVANTTKESSNLGVYVKWAIRAAFFITGVVVALNA